MPVGDGDLLHAAELGRELRRGDGARFRPDRGRETELVEKRFVLFGTFLQRDQPRADVRGADQDFGGRERAPCRMHVPDREPARGQRLCHVEHGVGLSGPAVEAHGHGDDLEDRAELVRSALDLVAPVGVHELRGARGVKARQ